MVQPTVTIQGLIDRMNSSDKDFRFMATNDLMGELQRENIRWDDDSETKVTLQIVGLLTDKNGEVQNLAVRCLGFLVSKIKDERRQIVIRQLCKMLDSDSEESRDIASIALKTIVAEIPTTRKMIEIINHDLNPNLMGVIAHKKDINVQLESLDILNELINRVGSQLNGHDKIQQHLLSQLDSERSAVRKRSMNALSSLLSCCSEELFNRTITLLIEALVKSADSQPPCTMAKTLLQCLATVIRSTGHRSNIEQFTQVLPIIYSLCKINDDELREYSLQTFESYVRRCPKSVNGSLPDIIRICIEFLSYDPNYNYDEDDDDDEAMDMDGDDDDASESADDYSDDDDLSWKVRRASAKCLEAVILSRRDMINDLFVSIAPILISRFKEREESVKSDIIQTFLSLLKQVHHIVKETRSNYSQLIAMTPDIVGRSSNLLREKSVKIRQIVLQMFTEIINIHPNALSAHISSLVPGILYSLADKNSTSNMKIDALTFVRELMRTHEPSIFYPQVQSLLPAIINAVGDTFYKISSEALLLLAHLVSVMRPINCEPMTGYEPIIGTIYGTVLEKMKRTDVDLEIKERSISCMSQIIATFGDKLPQELPVALNMLHDKLNNDATRLVCVKALIKVANSPINMSLSSLFPKAFTTLAPFLRKNSRPLKVATLILIENVVKRSVDLLDDQSAQNIILNDIPSLINEGDLYIAQLIFTMLNTVIMTHKAFHPIIPQQVLPETLQLVRSPLLQGQALQAMLNFFSSIVESSFPGLDHKTLLAKLVEPIYSGVPVHKQAYNSTAKAIAAISVGDKARALATVEQLINDSKQENNSESTLTLILLSIGEIGRVQDLSQVPNLVDVLLHAFTLSSEDVKSAGSYALGCVAVGNLSAFLPVILHEIEARNKRQYLILHSLREVISAGRLDDLDAVWTLLMKHCECQEEGTRNVVSECLGKLTLLKPKVLLERLIRHLKNDYADKPQARATIVAAIKFAITDQPHEIDELLRGCIGEFIETLRDEDMNVRRVALITFNSAAHNKPSLVMDKLPQILPLLYAETDPKPELVREVEMGPFKHRVDDGLDSRKAAFECMYTFLDTCQDQLDIFEFLTYVEHGLNDHYDIKMLTYLMLNRLATLCPSAVLQRMDKLMAPIEEVCKFKPKETSVKQEHDKQDELKRSALRAFDALKSIPIASRHPAIVRFYEDCILGDKYLDKLYKSIHRDTTNNKTNNSLGDGHARMDIG